MEELNNFQWMMKALQTAMTIDRLNSLAGDIKYDAWEELEYTLDAAKMEELRAAYRKRLGELGDDPRAQPYEL